MLTTAEHIPVLLQRAAEEEKRQSDGTTEGQTDQRCNTEVTQITRITNSPFRLGNARHGMRLNVKL